MAGTMGYHGVNNAIGADDDSWLSINEGLMDQIQQVQLAKNPSAQATNDNVSALSAETRELREALLKTQQQLAMFTRQTIGATPTAAPTWPHIIAQPTPTYIPRANTRIYAPTEYSPAPPPHILQSQQPFTNRHLPRHMDGEGDAAALEHADKEA